ncbi:hypothetical protein DFH09DRAFT_1411003 [Mycena vulgaris]|nr:hypothetical protein DFH09DRAFT_1411003 [Mycena vulgaris]
MDAFNFPEDLPPLPPNPNPWTANVLAAYQVLNNAFVRALEALRQEDSDALRYKLLSSNIVDNLIPVLENMEEDEEDPNDNDEEPELDREEELENQIQADQAQNIRHAPIKVARHSSPFEDKEVEADFLQLLSAVLSQVDELPENYGVLPEEWDDDDYDEIETIRTRTNGKELVVVLPRSDWFPRAVQWAQALDLLNRVLDEMDNG